MYSGDGIKYAAELVSGESLPLSRSRCAISGYPFMRGFGAGLLMRSVPQA